MRDTCSQQHQRIETFRLNCFLGRAAAFSDVAQDHDMPNLFCCSWDR
jgi:hypothetical protein